MQRNVSMGNGLRSLAAGSALLLAGLCVSGCQRMLNGPHQEDAAQMRPDQVHDFNDLYGRNCSACHGADGKNGTSIPMNNPVYMAVATDAQIRQVTANGQPGTLMPAFGRSAGGLLTDTQIDVIVAGMRQRWGKPMPGLNPPPYAAVGKADVAHGAQVYAQGCASCHGAVAPAGADAQPGSATRPGKAGSIVDPTFLALLSDQALRTITIAGRPDIGQPDWRGDIPGRPLTEPEITDVVAWVASHRQPLPGQSYPDPAGPSQTAPKPGVTELERRTQ